MYSYDTKIRVRYGETDQMGVVHHSTYALYYEEGRTEALRHLGLSYREIESRGIFMPVISLTMKYLRSAYYDEQLTIRTYIKEMPTSKITFEYETYNEKNECISKGETVLAIVNKETQRPCRAPEWLTELLAKNMKKHV